MRAAVMTGPGSVEVTTVEDPTPTAGEVVVEVASVGICGTDLHILAGEHGVLPVIPGHEVSGTVVAVGTGGPDSLLGARVAVDPTLPCGTCRQCRRGRTNLCATIGALGVTVAGGAARFMAAPAASCVVLPEGVDLEAAALIEPLSCAVRGWDVLRTQVGATVVIYGAGTMGLLLLSLAERAGARSVDVIDVNEERLQHASTLGCTRTAASADAVDDGDGWDVVIDATGNAAAIQDGVRRVASGGTFLQFGVPSPDIRIEVSPYEIFNREITLAGSKAILHSFGRAAELFAAGAVDWRRIVTTRLPLSRYTEALEGFRRGEGIKTHVDPRD